MTQLPRFARADDPSADAATRGFIRGTARDRGYERAAKFLLLLGKDPAAIVLSHLNEEEVTGITTQMSATHAIESREAYRILEEFGVLVKTRDLYARGGAAQARSMLVAAFGEARGAEMYDSVMYGAHPHPFSFLADVEAEQVVSLLRSEPTAVVAVIVAHLAPRLAAKVVSSLEPTLQGELVARIAALGTVPADTIQRTEAALQRKIRAQGRVDTRAIDGTSVLAEILCHMEEMREDAILGGLKNSDSELAEEVRRKMVTEELIDRTPDLELQRLLGEMSDRAVVLVLRAAGRQSGKRLRTAMSAGRVQLLNEDNRALGTVLAAESEGALRELLELIYRRSREGTIELRPRSQATSEDAAL